MAPLAANLLYIYHLLKREGRGGEKSSPRLEAAIDFEGLKRRERENFHHPYSSRSSGVHPSLFFQKKIQFFFLLPYLYVLVLRTQVDMMEVAKWNGVSYIRRPP